MPAVKCDKCKEEITFNEGEGSVVCPKCGLEQKTAKDATGSSVNKDDNPLLRRAFLLLEDGQWAQADEHLEKVLDQEPENAKAYLGKLMVDTRIRKPQALVYSVSPLDANENYTKILRFGDEAIIKELRGYNRIVKERCAEYNMHREITSGVSVEPLTGTTVCGRIVALLTAAMALLFIIVPTVFCGTHVSVLDWSITFSEASSNFWIAATLTAYISIVLFVIYAILQIVRLKKPVASGVRAYRILFYLMCVLTVVLIFIGVKDINVALGVDGLKGTANDIVNDALDRANDIVNGALGNAGDALSGALESVENIAKGSVGIFGAAALENAWYAAAVLGGFGLITAFAPSLFIKKKTGIIISAAFIVFCLILLMVV